MSERSFAEDVKQLGYGRGDILKGEGILAITKALLQSGVSYVGGYPGAPISHLLDVMADANESLLEPMGIYFELSGSEAAAAALLGASINYPMRGAVTWKSVVGTNVASDALSHVASAGVLGGALVVIGEDYGEGASILQERTHSAALKSSIPLLDPRNSLQSFARFVEEGYVRRDFWSDAGWTWREKAAATHPPYWRRDGGRWLRRDFDRWVQKDIEYIERWSIWLDAPILLRTIPSVIRGDGR